MSKNLRERNLTILCLLLLSLPFSSSLAATVSEEAHTATKAQLIIDAESAPSPFSPPKEATGIYYTLKSNVKAVEASVFDIAGNLIWAKRFDGNSLAKTSEGQCYLQWDGRSNNGELVGSGVYIYLLSIMGISGQRDAARGKVIVLR